MTAAMTDPALNTDGFDVEHFMGLQVQQTWHDRGISQQALNMLNVVDIMEG